MSILDKFLGITETRNAESRSYSVSDLFLPASPNSTVSTDEALTNSAVWGCVRILTENIATLPVHIFKQDGDARLPLDPAPSWASFGYGDNNRIDVLTQIMTSLLTDGNAYVATYRDSKGMILFLEVLDPAEVAPQFEDGSVVYMVSQTDGTEAKLTRMDILHIKGLSMPGTLEGLSPIKFHTTTIGLSNAATEFGRKYFDNGTVPGGVISVEGEPSAAAIKSLKASWTLLTEAQATLTNWQCSHRACLSARYPGRRTRLSLLTPDSFRLVTSHVSTECHHTSSLTPLAPPRGDLDLPSRTQPSSSSH